MASSSPHSAQESLGLPQYGFGTDVDFTSLMRSNHFLFRVYTPRGPTPRPDDAYFIAPKFDVRYNSPLEDSLWEKAFDIDLPDPSIGTYADVVKHMDWTTRLSSPFISTSFSFSWSIWEALRRYHFGMKKDVEIAVIDARAVSQRAVTAVDLLQLSLPSERKADHWKWYQFSQESQSVLVHGCIPSHAVLASIPLLRLLDKLPSYFLKDPLLREGGTLATIGWDYTEKKRNFRTFCLNMSNNFLHLPSESQLQDTTTRSVRLALTFLRPWFHACVIDDSDRAIDFLCSLSYSIAQWPGQWWVGQHPEIKDIIHSIVLSIVEEIWESRRGRKVESTLSRIITENQPSQSSNNSIVAVLEDSMTFEHVDVPTPPMPTFIPEALKPSETTITITPSPFVSLPPAPISRSHSHETRTPITPPDTPERRPVRKSLNNRSSRTRVPSTPESPLHVPAALKLNAFSFPLPPTPPMDKPTFSINLDGLLPPFEEAPRSASIQEQETISSPSHMIDSSVSTLDLDSSPPPADDVPHTVSDEAPEMTTPAKALITELPPAPTLPPAEGSPEYIERGQDNVDPIRTSFSYMPIPEKFFEEQQSRRREKIRASRRRGISTLETGACLVAGFLIGTFLTLVALAPQRRVILHLT